MDRLPPPPPPPVPQLPEAMLAPELPEVPWRTREALLVLLFAIVSGLFFSMLLAQGFQNDDPTLALLVVVLLEGSLGVWVFLWIKLRHGVGLKSLGLRFKRSDIGAGILAALLGLGVGAVINAVVLSIAQDVTNKKVETPQQLPEINHKPQWALAFVAVVIVAPIAEELFFRGFLYQALRKWRGVPQGILISALFFGLAHVSIIIIPAIFALGVILAYMFERRRSLSSTIAAHMTYNLIGFILIVAGGAR